MTFPPDPVPDLLNRFVPTPYKMIAQGFSVETNDLDLLEQFDDRDRLHALTKIAPGFHFRMIREARCLQGSDEVRVMCAESVCVVTIGLGTIIMVDRKLHRLLSFVAADISEKQLIHSYLPMALQHAGCSHRVPPEANSKTRHSAL